MPHMPYPISLTFHPVRPNRRYCIRNDLLCCVRLNFSHELLLDGFDLRFIPLVKRPLLDALASNEPRRLQNLKMLACRRLGSSPLAPAPQPAHPLPPPLPAPLPPHRPARPSPTAHSATPPS